MEDTNGLTLDQLFIVPTDLEPLAKGKTYVGIDFGTSTTVVSVAMVDPRTHKITSQNLNIEQEDFDRAKISATLVPTVLAFVPPNRLLVGEGAYKLKGRPDFKTNTNLWHSFKMGLGTARGPEWAEFSDTEKIHSPFDATMWFFCFLRKKIVQAVEANGWSTDIRYAVSVPASFESNQRADLLRALSKAGIDVNGKSLIDEPNAAFIGYINPDEYVANHRIQMDKAEAPKVLVFDFGAGTCDISILSLSRDFEGLHSSNISISQFTALGGNDFDRRIATRYLAPRTVKASGLAWDDFHSEQQEVIVESLMGAAERLKIAASRDYHYLLGEEPTRRKMIDESRGVKIELDYELYTELGQLRASTFTLSYGEFEDTVRHFFRRGTTKDNTVFALLDSAIHKAKIGKEEIDYVMMIGGSSKNPIVVSEIASYFPAAQMLLPTDMQSLVSEGAALHSLMLNAFGTTIVRPIMSEAIVVPLRTGDYFPVVEASTEIPLSVDCEGKLITAPEPMEQLEIPVCVGTNQKLLSNLVIKSSCGDALPPCAPILHRRWRQQTIDKCNYDWLLYIAREMNKEDYAEIKARHPKQKQKDVGYNQDNLPDIIHPAGDQPF